ncbi:MAG TPA: pilus assembly protein PilB, partial [Nitrospiraceae bacterium]|nr:pilus assembly protein PilB [Nitrospiraceae bacterium]
MQRHFARPSLADVFVRQGILPKRVVDQVLTRLGGSIAALGPTLLEEGTISEQQLAQALAAQYGLPYDPLIGYRVDQEFYSTISVKLMRRHP